MLKELKIDRQHVDIYLVELKYNYCICTLTEEFRLFFSNMSFLKHICKIKYWYVNCIAVYLSFSLTLSLIHLNGWSIFS